MKTVIEMARAAGFPKWDDHEPVTVDMYARFAELVRADEREACAKVCDDNDPRDGSGYSTACEALAEDIRARSNT
ncbi:hypothetical protein UFOVP372_26 [uncultured Caudovirales phage]|uniref:Uncharacterized protein n=1 Tax=uncultured Caudovirales phage TaxID=2100421 RepID=A0A6J7X5Z1_9CAUD|nr:hypothetical protein UFOVP372_26 [uncultured Caudovirales phage]